MFAERSGCLLYAPGRCGIVFAGERERKMGKLVAAYESYLMNIRHASDNTVASYLRDVRQFTTYLEQTDGPALEACTQETVCAYVRHLTSIGKSPATVSRCVASLKSFYGYCVSTGAVAQSPVHDIPQQKAEKRLPQILTGREVELLLEQPKCTDMKGYRDKAMLETLYATGMRVSEMIALNVSDVSLAGGFVRCIGNGKSRIIPIYPAAIRALTAYVTDIRPNMIAEPDEQALFVNLNAAAFPDRAFGRSSSTISRPRRSTRRSHRIRCVTALRPICSKTARTCIPYRRCSATAISPPRRSMRRS